MAAKTDLKTLLGLPPTSQNAEGYISSLSSLAGAGNDDKAQIKVYPDAVFVNYIERHFVGWWVVGLCSTWEVT